MYKTEDKMLLLDFFKKNQDIVIDSTTIVKKFEPLMNRATVYRVLIKLENECVIRKTYNDDKKVYEYQYSNNCNNHLHLKCIKCGNIIHLDCHDASHFIDHIFNEHGFKIDEFKTTIYGLCKSCQNENN